MVTSRVVIEILSPLPLIDQQDGQTVLELWKAYLPQFLPEKVGNWEPIDRPFDADNFSAVLGSWKWPFLAEREHPKVNCGVWMRKNAKQQLHSTLIWELYLPVCEQSTLLTFLETAAVALKADFACLHLLTASEIERGRANRTVTALDKKATQFNFFLASKDLKRRIPDIYWATVFGRPYLELFSRERLLSAPAYRTGLLSEGIVLLQISKELSDVGDHTGTFGSARERAILHLGENAFFRLAAEAAGDYHAPTFEFA
jgi:hypothetical protein